MNIKLQLSHQDFHWFEQNWDSFKWFQNLDKQTSFKSIGKKTPTSKVPKPPPTCQAALITALLIGSSVLYSLCLVTGCLPDPLAPVAARCAPHTEGPSCQEIGCFLQLNHSTAQYYTLCKIHPSETQKSKMFNLSWRQGNHCLQSAKRT